MCRTSIMHSSSLSENNEQSCRQSLSRLPSETTHLLAESADNITQNHLHCARWFDPIKHIFQRGSNNSVRCNQTNENSNDDNNVKLNQSNENSNPKKEKKNSFFVILFGQTIALALASGNAASSTLENKYQICVPTFQTGFVYLFLSFHLVYLFVRHKHKQQMMHQECNGILNSDTELMQMEVNDTCNTEMAALVQVQRCSPSLSDLPIYTNEKLSDKSMHDLNYQKRQQPPSLATTKNHPTHFFPFTSVPLHTPWYNYLLLAILDVEANYLAMLSFQHTSLSSSMLLTSLSVLSTLSLRHFVFGVWKRTGQTKTSQGGKRLMGVMICIFGGCLWLWVDFYREGRLVDHSVSYQFDVDGKMHDGGVTQNDVEELQHEMQQSQSKESTSHRHIYGDLLALSAAFLYGLNDVLAEYTVKSNNDRIEYLGMLGLFGTLISFTIQVPLLEKNRVVDLLSDLTKHDGSSSNIMGIGLHMAWFLFMLCYFYISITVFLSKNDATILNLSLQTCPLWAVILTMWENTENGVGSWIFPPPAFFAALAMVVVGMYLYESHSENECDRLDVHSYAAMDEAESAKQTKLIRLQNTSYAID